MKKGRNVIQGEAKVGVQYIVNYCIPTLYLLLAHTLCFIDV